jgi:hypothetical protein
VVSIYGGMDGSRPLRPEEVEGPGGAQFERQVARAWHLAIGTLACPSCDAPVAPPARPMSPADPLACPVCGEAGAVRDFLSLAEPTRPARVVVRVIQPPRPVVTPR